MFRQYYLEPFYKVWYRFKDGFVWNKRSPLIFYFGLNEDSKNWVDDGTMTSGFPLIIRNENDAYFLLEDMINYNYHWYTTRKKRYYNI